MATFLNWQAGVARLSSYGDVVFDDSEKATEYTEHYTVIMPDAEAIASLSTVSNIPSNGDRSTRDGLKHLRVYSIRFNKLDENSSVWQIDVSYGIPGKGKCSLITEDNGSDYVSVSWGVDEITSDMCYDVDNNPVINSAGDPFDSVPQKTAFAPHITIVRRERNFPNLSLIGTVNSEPITILGVTFGKHCARLKMQVSQIAAKKSFEVTYEIIGMTNIAPAEGYNTGVFEDWGWDCPMVECGYQFYDENGTLRKFTTIDNSGVERDVSCPQLLDFDGKDARGTNPYIKRFVPYFEDSWNSLKFPVSADSIKIME